MKRTLAAVLAMVMVLDLGIGQAHVYAQENISTEAAETVTEEMKEAETEAEEEAEAAEEAGTTVEESEETEAAEDTEETEETEEADEGLETVGELAPLPDDPEYIKLQQEAQTADGLSVDGHLRGANWDGYTHNAKFNGRIVRN